MRRRVIAFGAAIAVFAAVIGLGRNAGTADLALLYAGLDPAAAGGVITALDQRGIAYEVRGDSIHVPRADRDFLRLALAGEGLPESSTQGYELLDSLSGFGTTSQMFDAAYWRAKEGELARTILSMPGVRAARVHISAGTGRPFARDPRATAAVTVTTGGGTLDPAQARALRWLVASAVPGLGAADVAVIDSVAGLVPMEDGVTSGDARADDLRQRALRLLEARVGVGNAVVEVAVESVTESETIRERRVDPESRVAVSTETEERSSSTQGAADGAVTVASNLPDGAAGAPGGGSQSSDSESRTTTNFELSETSRELLRVPGDVRRLSVAVLVNDIVAIAPDGTRTTTPREAAELEALGELVSSAVGIDSARGDVVTIRSMSFEPVVAAGTDGVAAGVPLDMMGLIRIGVLAAVALILGLFVLRPILTSGRRPPPVIELPPPAVALAAPDRADPPERTLAADAADIRDPAEADPVARLRRLIEARQDETIQILQDWIEDPPQRERT